MCNKENKCGDCNCDECPCDKCKCGHRNPKKEDSPSTQSMNLNE